MNGLSVFAPGPNPSTNAHARLTVQRNLLESPKLRRTTSFEYAPAYAGLTECLIERAHFFGMEPKKAFFRGGTDLGRLGPAGGHRSEATFGTAHEEM